MKIYSLADHRKFMKKDDVNKEGIYPLLRKEHSGES